MAEAAAQIPEQGAFPGFEGKAVYGASLVVDISNRHRQDAETDSPGE